MRELIEDMVGKRKPFSASIPWLYIFVSSTGAILEDIVAFATFYTLPTWQDQFYAIIGGASCILVGTPMTSVVFLWCSSKEYRFGGKAPMIILAPLIGWTDWTLLICGFLSTDYTFCVVQFWLAMAFGQSSSATPSPICWVSTSRAESPEETGRQLPTPAATVML